MVPGNWRRAQRRKDVADCAVGRPGDLGRHHPCKSRLAALRRKRRQRKRRGVPWSFTMRFELATGKAAAGKNVPAASANLVYEREKRRTWLVLPVIQPRKVLSVC